VARDRATVNVFNRATGAPRDNGHAGAPLTAARRSGSRGCCEPAASHARSGVHAMNYALFHQYRDPGLADEDTLDRWSWFRRDIEADTPVLALDFASF
jgi:hypothetical protein